MHLRIRQAKVLKIYRQTEGGSCKTQQCMPNRKVQEECGKGPKEETKECSATTREPPMLTMTNSKEGCSRKKNKSDAKVKIDQHGV